MAGLEVRGLDEFDRDLAALINKSPDMQRKFHEQAADLLKQTVDANIDASINDSGGGVKSGQESVVGSLGGYAAIRPKSGDMPGKNLRYGELTAYLTYGHNIRRPSGSARPRPSRARFAYVLGRDFYGAAGRGLDAKIISMANKLVEDFAKELGG